jgi:hypothetical protein
MSVGGLSPSLLKVGENIICSMTINPAVPIMPWFSWPSPLCPSLLHQILCQLPPISLFSINQNFLQHQHTWRTSQELALTSAE